MASSRKKADSKVILILFLVIIAILVAWYYLFYTPTQVSIENLKLDIESKESEVELLNTQFIKQTQMLRDIDYLRTVNPAVPAFDNYKQIATVIDVILAQSSSFNITFQTPQKSSAATAPGVTTSRRMLNISFEAQTYQTAKDIIADIKDIPFRLQISNVNISMITSNIYVPVIEDEESEEYVDPNSLGNSPVQTILSVTFFENNYTAA